MLDLSAKFHPPGWSGQSSVPNEVKENVAEGKARDAEFKSPGSRGCVAVAPRENAGRSDTFSAAQRRSVEVRRDENNDARERSAFQGSVRKHR